MGVGWEAELSIEQWSRDTLVPLFFWVSSLFIYFTSSSGFWMVTHYSTSCCWLGLRYKTISRNCFIFSTFSPLRGSSKCVFIHSQLMILLLILHVVQLLYLLLFFISPPPTTTLSLLSEAIWKASWRSLLISPKRIRLKNYTICWGLTCCGGSKLMCSRTCRPRQNWLCVWNWALCRSEFEGVETLTPFCKMIDICQSTKCVSSFPQLTYKASGDRSKQDLKKLDARELQHHVVLSYTFPHLARWWCLFLGFLSPKVKCVGKKTSDRGAGY